MLHDGCVPTKAPARVLKDFEEGGGALSQVGHRDYDPVPHYTFCKQFLDIHIDDVVLGSVDSVVIVSYSRVDGGSPLYASSN